jgi:hypothetical protein
LGDVASSLCAAAFFALNERMSWRQVAFALLKMPATAGRVKMPANNRVSSSVALRTTDVWSKTIGYDPYAGAAQF